VDRIAETGEQLQAFPNRESLCVAELGDRWARHVFHDEIGIAPFGRAEIVNPGDMAMIEERQQLLFVFETA